MKTIFNICLIFSVAGVVCYYHMRPVKEVVKVVEIRQVAQVITAPQMPNLDYIIIKNGLPIRNARVKEVYRDSIIFLCSRGLVQVPFADLPPEFKSYYQYKNNH